MAEKKQAPKKEAQPAYPAGVQAAMDKAKGK